MIVIVPHQDIELKLIRSQKEIIGELINQNKDLIPYAAVPLWIETGFDSVEEAKSKITKVMILHPEYNEKSESLVCPVEIETADGVLESKLNFICGLLRRCAPRNDVGCELFPLEVKIFRLGECTSSKPGVYELSNTKWVKLT